MFQDVLNDYIRWGLIILFLGGCLLRREVRALGWIFGFIALIAAFVRQFVTTKALDNGDAWANALVVFGVCWAGHLWERQQTSRDRHE